MKISHLEAVARMLKFEDLKSYLTQRYLKDKVSVEEMAEELDIGPKMVRRLLLELEVKRRVREIPLTLRDAKHMGPDAIAKAHNVSRSTAWRWKRTILAQESDL